VKLKNGRTACAAEAERGGKRTRKRGEKGGWAARMKEARKWDEKPSGEGNGDKWRP